MGAAQAGAAAGPRRIDVHHHFAPPAWVTEVRGRPLLQPANTTWTPEKSIADMDHGGVAAAVVSITNPGLWFGDAAVTRRLARACNDYGAKLVQDHPTRFGLFAAMPLPDVDATLAEIAYAYDTLKVDGVGVLTSYGDVWLGNPAFRPVMEELHRRRAVVHVHPTAANCCKNLDYAPGVGAGSMEYGTDTTRAIIGVAFSGDLARYLEHPVHLVARRRHRAVSRRTNQRRVGQREGSAAERFHRRDQETLLRSGRRGEQGRDRLAARAGARDADSLRHRLPARRHELRRREHAARARDVQRRPICARSIATTPSP